MPKKIADIKYEFEHAAMEDWNPLFDLYKEDGRSGVAKLIAAYQKRQKAYEDECQRLEKMQEFEEKYGNDFVSDAPWTDTVQCET